MSLILAIVAACVLGLMFSVIFSWASDKSPLWNIGFAIALVLATTAGLVLAIVLVFRRISE